MNLLNIVSVTSTFITRGRKCCLNGHLSEGVLKKINTTLHLSNYMFRYFGTSILASTVAVLIYIPMSDSILEDRINEVRIGYICNERRKVFEEMKEMSKGKWKR